MTTKKIEAIADQIVEMLMVDGCSPNRMELVAALEQRRGEVASRLRITPRSAERYFTDDTARVWARNILAGV